MFINADPQSLQSLQEQKRGPWQITKFLGKSGCVKILLERQGDSCIHVGWETVEVLVVRRDHAHVIVLGTMEEAPGEWFGLNVDHGCNGEHGFESDSLFPNITSDPLLCTFSNFANGSDIVLSETVFVRVNKDALRTQ